jgi:hypothetical protein
MRMLVLTVDAEGVDLSRAGALTVLSLRALPGAGPAYVVDVLALGGRAAFASGLGALLQDAIWWTLNKAEPLLLNSRLRKCAFASLCPLLCICADAGRLSGQDCAEKGDGAHPLRGRKHAVRASSGAALVHVARSLTCAVGRLAGTWTSGR